MASEEYDPLFPTNENGNPVMNPSSKNETGDVSQSEQLLDLEHIPFPNEISASCSSAASSSEVGGQSDINYSRDFVASDSASSPEKSMNKIQMLIKSKTEKLKSTQDTSLDCDKTKKAHFQFGIGKQLSNNGKFEKLKFSVVKRDVPSALFGDDSSDEETEKPLKRVLPAQSPKLAIPTQPEAGRCDTRAPKPTGDVTHVVKCNEENVSNNAKEQLIAYPLKSSKLSASDQQQQSHQVDSSTASGNDTSVNALALSKSQSHANSETRSSHSRSRSRSLDKDNVYTSSRNRSSSRERGRRSRSNDKRTNSRGRSSSRDRQYFNRDRQSRPASKYATNRGWHSRNSTNSSKMQSGRTRSRDRYPKSRSRLNSKSRSRSRGRSYSKEKNSPTKPHYIDAFEELKRLKQLSSNSTTECVSDNTEVRLPPLEADVSPQPPDISPPQPPDSVPPLPPTSIPPPPSDNKSPPSPVNIPPPPPDTVPFQTAVSATALSALGMQAQLVQYVLTTTDQLCHVATSNQQVQQTPLNNIGTTPAPKTLPPPSLSVQPSKVKITSSGQISASLNIHLCQPSQSTSNITTQQNQPTEKQQSSILQTNLGSSNQSNVETIKSTLTAPPLRPPLLSMPNQPGDSVGSRDANYWIQCPPEHDGSGWNRNLVNTRFPEVAPIRFGFRGRPTSGPRMAFQRDNLSYRCGSIRPNNSQPKAAAAFSNSWSGNDYFTDDSIADDDDSYSYTSFNSWSYGDFRMPNRRKSAAPLTSLNAPHRLDDPRPHFVKPEPLVEATPVNLPTDSKPDVSRQEEIPPAAVVVPETVAKLGALTKQEPVTNVSSSTDASNTFLASSDVLTNGEEDRHKTGYQVDAEDARLEEMRSLVGAEVVESKKPIDAVSINIPIEEVAQEKSLTSIHVTVIDSAVKNTSNAADIDLKVCDKEHTARSESNDVQSEIKSPAVDVQPESNDVQSEIKSPTVDVQPESNDVQSEIKSPAVDVQSEIKSPAVDVQSESKSRMRKTECKALSGNVGNDGKADNLDSVVSTAEKSGSETCTDKSSSKPISSTPGKLKMRWLQASLQQTTNTIAPPQAEVDSSQGESKVKNKKAAKNDDESGKTVNVQRKEPAHFGAIEDNIYLVTSKKTSKSVKEAKRMVCDCTTSEEDRALNIPACGDDCLNRMLMIECGSRCACGEFCTNKRFQRHLNAKAEIFLTEKKGHGLKAMEYISKGSFIREYVGEVLGIKDFKHRVKQYARDKHQHYYFMALNAEEVIDATQKGNISRFINHSCDPNAETQKWTVNGRLCIGFFAKRDIEPDEEITFDYQFERYGEEAQKCYCGSSNCRGLIGGEKKQSFKQINFDKVVSKKKKDEQKKKEYNFSDNTFADEIERLCSLNGLTRSEHVLQLSRMMVRAETINQRKQLADILLIINILRKLPIGNKNVIQETKVLSVVERWLKDCTKRIEYLQQDASMAKCKSTSDTQESKESNSKSYIDTQTSTEQGNAAETKASPNTDLNVLHSTSSLPSSENPPLNKYSDNISTSITVDQTVSQSSQDMDTSMVAGSDMLTCDDTTQSSDVTSAGDKPACKTVSEEQTTDDSDSRSAVVDEDSQDGCLSQDESIVVDSSVHSHNAAENELEDVDHLRKEVEELLETWSQLKETFKIPKKEKDEERKRTVQELDTTRFEESFDRYESRKDNSDKLRYRPGGRFEKKRKRDLSPDQRSGRRRDDWSYAAEYKQPLISKEQRRRMFEEQVRAEEEQQAYEQQQQQQRQRQQQQQRQYELEQKLIQEQQQQQQLLRQTLVAQRLDGGAGINLGYSNNINCETQADYLSGRSSSGPDYNLQSQIPAVQAVPPVQAVQAIQSASYTSVNPVMQPSSAVSSIPTQAPTLCYYTTPQGLVVQQIVQTTSQSQTPLIYMATAPVTELTTEAPPPPPKIPKEPKLAADWRAVKDSEGRTYYYHRITRQSQWEPPTGAEEVTTEMELDTPPNDAKKSKAKSSKKATMAAADTSADAKKIKEQFKSAISVHIRSLLNSYMKPDCKTGKITNKEDYKLLAKKLTHAVMDKELKHCRHHEDLEVNENVKFKAKEFLKKYMAKCGPVYRRDKDDKQD